MEKTNIEKLLETVEALRGENGCKWDREQTHESIRKNMLEEAYEVIDAINSKNSDNLKEELGDVLLQVVLHSQIADDCGEFNFEDVAGLLNQKLINRHPHVFGNTEVHNVDEILVNWEKIKKEEKPYRKSVLDGISKSQSALMSAQKLSVKAAKMGFEWEKEDDVMACVYSEIGEFLSSITKDEMEVEFGDILFALVNLARWRGIDAEQALIRANSKFEKRFRKMEEIASKKNVELDRLTVLEWNRLWTVAKLTSEEHGN